MFFTSSPLLQFLRQPPVQDSLKLSFRYSKSNIFPFAARTACFNSGQRVEDHFVEVTDMFEIGNGAAGLNL